MTVLKYLFLVILVSALYFVLNINNSNVVLDDGSLKKNNDIEVNKKNIIKRLPDYDPRKKIKPIVAPEQYAVIQNGNENIEEVLQNSEKELQAIQKKFSQVLDDPLAKKDLENQAKKVGIEYKKALLVKLKNGEL